MKEILAKLVNFLILIEEVETLAADLYTAYQQRFVAEDEDVAYFFYRMGVEERGHAALAKYVKKLVKSNPQSFVDVKGQDIEVDGLPATKAWLLGRIISISTASVNDALTNAFELETHIGEGYGIIKLSSFVSHAPKIERLLKSLTEDKEHTGAVTAFAKARGITL